MLWPCLDSSLWLEKRMRMQRSLSQPFCVVSVRADPFLMLKTFHQNPTPLHSIHDGHKPRPLILAGQEQRPILVLLLPFSCPLHRLQRETHNQRPLLAPRCMLHDTRDLRHVQLEQRRIRRRRLRTHQLAHHRRWQRWRQLRTLLFLRFERRCGVGRGVRSGR